MARSSIVKVNQGNRAIIETLKNKMVQFCKKINENKFMKTVLYVANSSITRADAKYPRCGQNRAAINPLYTSNHGGQRQVRERLGYDRRGWKLK
ncbi:MAG: hypothetical protein AAF601_00520 [Pseudomonadota bacterium]